MENSKEQIDKDGQRMEPGRILTGAMLGAAFAACLTIAGGNLQGDKVHYAMFAFVGGIPLLAMHWVVTGPGQGKKHHVSALMEFMPVFGVFSVVVGLAFLFEQAVPGTGLLFGAFSLLVGWVCVQSQDRAKRLRLRTRKNAA